MNIKNRLLIFLLVLIFFSTILRLYNLDQVPPSLTWDEASVGYNAWTIANYAKDEYGNFFPIYFRSFGEDKQPIHIYVTALFVKVLGLSEFNIRLPAAIFGVLNVLLIFFLVRILFNNNLIALISSIFLAISPQSIFFSRFNHEANFALFFFMLGLLLFYYSVKRNRNFLSVSLLCFIFSMVSYHAAEVIVPPIILLVILLYYKKFRHKKINLLITSIIFMGFVILIFLQPKFLGTTRFSETVQRNDKIEETIVFTKTHNYILGRINLIVNQYFYHFNPKYLFISGDKNPRLSSQGMGEFYPADILFLLLGVFYLLYKRSRESLLLLAWALIGPIPSSIVAEAPHAARAFFMTGSWNIIAALGFYTLINLVRKNVFKWIVIFLCTVCILFFWINYLNYYFKEFPKRYAIDWQYGMKEVVQHVKDHPEFDQVYVTAARSQPYIFFLYYLKAPLPDYLNTVIYNNLPNKSSNNVSFFGKYSFGGWNPIENKSLKGVLYILSPSEYDGLQYRFLFDIKKIIYYPNGTNAFFIVTLK